MTLATNLLVSTVRDALVERGGVLLVINRQDKVRQAVSLYRRYMYTVDVDVWQWRAG